MTVEEKLVPAGGWLGGGDEFYWQVVWARRGGGVALEQLLVLGVIVQVGDAVDRNRTSEKHLFVGRIGGLLKSGFILFAVNIVGIGVFVIKI